MHGKLNHDRPGMQERVNSARRLSIRFVGHFLVAAVANRLHRVGRRKSDASDATPDIAELQENYNIGPVDWAVIDASGTPEKILIERQTGPLEPA